MEKFDAHAAFEAEFGSLDNESKENTDLAMFLLSETGAIMAKSLEISIRQDKLKNLIEEANKKCDETLKKFVVVRQDGTVAGIVSAADRNEAVLMVKAEEARWSLGED